MKLGDLAPSNGAVKDTKRRGRGQGSGLGKTSGRGHKGAGSRSGNKKRPWFEGGQMPLVRRLPKRGFKNFLFKKDFQIVNLTDLERVQNDTIDPQTLFESGLIRSALKPVKILGDGELNRALNISATKFSSSAKDKIEKAGGTVTVL